MSPVTRRTLLAGSAAAAVAAPLAAGAPAGARRRPAPAPLGAGGEPTPLPRQAEIAAATGRGEPLMLVDLAAVDRNLAVLLEAGRTGGLALRPALKTLQSPQLCAYVLQRLPEPLGMIHHLGTVDEVVRRLPPGTDLLMGYPPTAGELREYLGRRPPARQRHHTLRITFDSMALLEELARLARATPRKLPLDVCLEVDSGAGRGGFVAGEGLSRAIAVLRAERERLRLGAVLCYDAAATVESTPAFRREVARFAQDRVRAVVAQLRAEAADLIDGERLVVNGPGTANFRNWMGTGAATEMSPGSAFLKPAYVDPFDAAFVRAHALAAPVLRVTSDHPTVPLLGISPPGADREEVLIKAGGWPTGNNPKLSRLVHPDGLRDDPFSGGRGANSSGAITAPKGALELGDYVLLHAEQITEALDYFGSVVAIREGTVRRVWANVGRWGHAALA